MKKIFWIKIKEFDRKIVSTAIESGVDGIYCPSGVSAQIKSLGIIKTLAPDGDLKPDKDFKEITIEKKEDEGKAEKLKGRIPVIIKNKDWTIIPLENLISKTSNIIQSVSNAAEAKLALETMEKGSDGIILDNPSALEVKNTAKIVQEAEKEKLALVKAKIVEIKALGISDRVCVDTASILPPGQGMLVGDSSSAFFLVHNENVVSPYCDPRPFRVNAGGVHAYVRLPNDRTKYLMELSSGDEIEIVDPSGSTSVATVGRVKIERRPMMLVTASYRQKKFTLLMQNAETIRLTSPEGKPLSITKLKKGNEVLAFLEEGGRHFGTKVKETIREK